ncbi:MAG: bifunctional methylenetetrahydrofolate dehydrogenase/methenyltetrahydrofolate cyclohydrolase FolD [Chlamydiia bacterium]|nr:bifunctional methylenetetrahydrofolate dehydrogenase/methenyltetrahydrofolate cyclohydrolase FolD [Chlamydiia bacterium]
MHLLDGKSIARKIQEGLKHKLSALKGRRPGLAFVLIGKDPSSQTYVRMKVKGCKEVGIDSKLITLPKDISENGLLKEIGALNQDDTIDGILVQQPLPSHLSPSLIVEAIDPLKDVDGFHPMNLGRLLLGEDGGFIACTPLGIVKLLESYQISTQGKEVVVIGRSNIVGKPLAALLMQKKGNATVTVAHSGTNNLQEVSKRADILIVAIGRPRFITPNMIKKGAIVIDVGINHTDEGLVGDVDFDAVKETAGGITPVPGGVGPMTIATLLTNTYESYKKRCD